jgi:hypothetical protein
MVLVTGVAVAVSVEVELALGMLAKSSDPATPPSNRYLSVIATDL